MRNTQSRFFFVLISLALTYCLPCPAQVATGTPPFGSFSGGPDVINLGNLDAHMTIPVLGKAGRGNSFVYNVTYDSSVYAPVSVSSVLTWQPVSTWGWNSSTAAVAGHLGASVTVYMTCPQIIEPRLPPIDKETIFTWHWTFYDYLGTAHPFPGDTQTWNTSPCSTAGSSSLNSTATDGSGYTLSATGPSGSVKTRKGTSIGPPINGFAGPGTLTDRNGNIVSVDSSGNITDTLGTVALMVAGSGTPSSPVTFTYTPPSGPNVSYTMRYASYTVQTSFGCSGVTEYSATGVSLVSEIDLPDGTKYLFTYEPTPGYSGDVTGRLASVTLPTGGTITYAYTGLNNGIECSDGSTAGLNRTTPDGEWKYVRAGSGTAWTTTVTDPSSTLNQTVINFQTVTPAAGPPSAFYETERQIYQGSTSGTLLKTIFTCYNATTSSCNSTAVVQPIAQRAVYVLWAGTGGLESLTNSFYNAYGNLTEKDEYAYAAGSPGAITRKTLITYASLGNGIVSMPASVTIEDGSSNIHSKTTYSYDQTGVTATSGTPQQGPITGSRGNATTISYLVGSTSLTRTYTYYDTGNVIAATDVNSAVTTYTYGSGTSCGNSFATSVSEPLSLSRSMVWNCTGGVQTSVTDENGQPTTTAYNDLYFWRPNKSRTRHRTWLILLMTRQFRSKAMSTSTAALPRQMVSRRSTALAARTFLKLRKANPQAPMIRLKRIMTALADPRERRYLTLQPLTRRIPRHQVRSQRMTRSAAKSKR